MMTSNMKSHSSNCCAAFAAAGTSMRICDILGTAGVAVSIIILRLVSLLALL